MAKYPLCTLSLGVPLTVASVGTLVTLLTDNKRLHVGFGIAWTALSLLHGWQHAGKMKRDLAGAQAFLRTGTVQDGKRPDAYTLALARARAHQATQ